MYENHKSQLQRSFFIFFNVISTVPIYELFICLFIYLFILFYLPHNNYKKYRKRRKKKWRGDLTETIGAYERLGLLEEGKKSRWKDLRTVFILTQ